MSKWKEKIKKKLNNRIEKIQIILNIPGALKARRAGCYFEIYSMVYRLKAMGLKPETILDIGANRGMFTKCAHYVFPHASIYAFEPLKDCYEELCNLKKIIEDLECYNVALAEKTGEAVIHQSSYDYSSSLLEMGQLHKEAFSYTADEKLEKVQIKKLDDVLHYQNLRKPILMKLDVQGYEKFVLLGSQGMLPHTDYILCEMSFRQLYKKQPVFNEVYQFLVDHQFQFMGPMAELVHPATNEVLQIDGLFIKTQEL